MLRSALATSALSIFGDHSDVMAYEHGLRADVIGFRARGARHGADSTAATLESRIPFLHFFDGFRTSHELKRSTFSRTNRFER